MLGTAAILWALHELSEVILLLILAFFFECLVAPLVTLVRRTVVIRGRPFPTPAAIGVVQVLLFGALAMSV